MLNNSEHKGHAIALYSGGLDSALAIILILRQNIKVTALNFMTHFGCDINDKSSCSSDPFSAAEKFGFTVKLVHLGQKFIEMVKSPEHGYGRNMNPCIDCRIMMLKEARDFMNLVGADFVVTGEVVSQRPMSQHIPQLKLVEKVSGLKGRLVRPLSAKILPPTEPELKGLINREQMEGIAGRSRKRQMQLARQFGLDDYPSPAAGCLLTDVGYSRRLRDLLRYTLDVDYNDLNLLRVGRHFRLGDKTKLVVGRMEAENDKIESLARSGDYLFEALDTGSPIVLMRGPANDINIKTAAAITARYCDLKYSARVEITYFMIGEDKQQEQTITIAPAAETTLENLRL